MKKLADRINSKYSIFRSEIFYADDFFFVLNESRIAKLCDPVGEYDETIRISQGTARFIYNYCDGCDIDLGSFADTLSFYTDDFAGYDENDSYTELFDDLDDEIRVFLEAALEKSISPYRAIRASALLASGECEPETWYMDCSGEYKAIIDVISAECELIDFDYTSDDNDEYWSSVIDKLPEYLYRGGETL